MPLFNDVFPANVVAFTSDRTIDFTLTEDQRVLSRPQKEFFLARLGHDIPEPVPIRQVHGDKIAVVDENCPRKGHVLEGVDGLVTDEPRLPLAVRTADCLPIFMYDIRRECIGLIHAGWRGSRKDIAGQTVKLMEKQWQSDPKDIKITFGPALRSCCYEVGGEFQEYFLQGLLIRDTRYYLDLPQINKDQLSGSGVPDGNIDDCGVCTCCDKNYFSYRREGQSA